MSKFQVGEMVAVSRVVDSVNAVLEGRVVFASVEPFLRTLRNPRVFIHVDDAQGPWTWLVECPRILSSVDNGDGWLIGAPMPTVSSPMPVVTTASETVAESGFGFGLLDKVSAGDVLLCGTGDAIAGCRAIGRADLASLMIDCRVVWNAHRAAIGKNLPGFGHEFGEWLSAARGGYRRISKKSNVSPRDQLLGGRKVMHATLLYLALATRRGDFSS